MESVCTYNCSIHGWSGWYNEIVTCIRDHSFEVSMSLFQFDGFTPKRDRPAPATRPTRARSTQTSRAFTFVGSQFDRRSPLGGRDGPGLPDIAEVFFHLMFLGRQVPKLKQARLASPKVRTPKPTKVALSEPYLVIEWVHLSDSPPVAEVIGAEGRQTQRENAHSRRLDPKSVYTTGCHGVKADSRTRQMFLRWTQVRR